MSQRWELGIVTDARDRPSHHSNQGTIVTMNLHCPLGGKNRENPRHERGSCVSRVANASLKSIKTVCQDGLLIVWSPAVLAFPPRIRSISVTAQLSLVSTMAFYQFMMLRHLSNLPFQPVLLPFHVRSSTHAGASGCLFAAMQCSICCLASKVILLQDHVKKHVGYLNSLE